MTATKAKEAGLIDRLAYLDKFETSIADEHDKTNQLVYVQNYGRRKVDTDFSGPVGLFKLMGMITSGNSNPNASSGKKIAVVYAVGPIMSGKSETAPFGGESTIGSTTIFEALYQANRDKNVAAIVLRIDSPGGSARGQRHDAAQIARDRKADRRQMGDVAASGGYYIAMGADKSSPSRGPSPVRSAWSAARWRCRGLFDKLGITTDVISRGDNSGDVFSRTEAVHRERRTRVLPA